MATEAYTHDAYTVGWVCALPKEQTAATALLDQRHTNLPKPRNDPNTYTLGSIGGHNIVIACLPKGKIGTVPAANVATHMIHAFPAIRFGLMVGIGGGVPPNVRLGDVVVSVPVDQYPGVVQWDMGKTEQGGVFRRTGALNSPPTLLLTALTRLETDHELEGTKIPQYLEELKERYPKVAAQYLRSDDLQDVLFSPDYEHVSRRHQGSIGDREMEEESDGEISDDCRHCDRAQTVKRKPRDLRVHYGLIASGNQVIKEARMRDQLSSDLGRKVLCIEMEAAGLMDGFPCIVIRGICDYADSHKNKVWHKHAAAVAAAFAKELLGYVIADEVSGEKPATALLETITETVDIIRENTTRHTQFLNKGKDMEIIDWISTIHYGAQQSDTLKRWHPETNQWFLCSQKYHDWLQTNGETLYCPGIPGAGKTIMVSAVVDDISYQFSTDPDVCLAYIYFNFAQQQEQTVESVLASLLTQFLRSRPCLPDHIRNLYKKHQLSRTQPTRDDLLDSLSLVVSIFERAFIVLDAIDECASENRAVILSDLLNFQSKTNINILATSRPHHDIASSMNGPNMTTIAIVPQNQDMSIMLHTRMRTFDEEIYDTRLRDCVASKIIEVAKGMFLLADLHLNALAALPTKGDILDALENLGEGADALVTVYEQSMERIESQGSGYAQLAKNILLWIVHARRVLSGAELQHALAIRHNTRAIDTDYCPSIRIIKSLCAGLVVIDEGSKTVRLVHYTTQEYFEKTHEKWFPEAQDHISKSCVAYLSLEAFDEPCEIMEEVKERLDKFPFYSYACVWWGSHAQLATFGEYLVDFLKKESRVQALMQSCLYLLRADDQSYWGPAFLTATNGLHLASLYGLGNVVKALLADYDVNTRDSYNNTPLSHAAHSGHVAVVKILLAIENVDVNIEDRQSETPLSKAALSGHKSVVELLLCTRKVDLSLGAYQGQLALRGASANGHEAVVELLLDEGNVGINTRSKATGRTPLSLATMQGHIAVVRLLLSRVGVKANQPDNHGRTPLSWAAERGNVPIVGLLLSTDKVDVNSPDYDGFSPLSWAATCGHTAVVEMLLGTDGITIDSQDNNGRTPLSWAVSSRHGPVVSLLLSTGKANVNLADRTGRTPLSWAIQKGFSDMANELRSAKFAIQSPIVKEPYKLQDDDTQYESQDINMAGESQDINTAGESQDIDMASGPQGADQLLSADKSYDLPLETSSLDGSHCETDTSRRRLRSRAAGALLKWRRR